MKKTDLLILAIETSCDETSVAVLRERAGAPELLSCVISSQVKLHAKFGGIVPMLAAREQQKNIEPVISQALSEAGKKLKDISYFAVTRGPGLIPSLHVGVNYARAISYAMGRPLLGINHIEGHMYSNWLRPIGEFPISKSQFPNKKGKDISKEPKFPILNLVVSGGHTELILMPQHGKYTIVGETQDDAAGEAFDKVARMMNLPYPGGPALSKAALAGNPAAFALPRPMLNSGNFDFSFSGLKTAVLYTICDPTKLPKGQTPEVPKNLDPKFIADLSASFQQAVVDVLVQKTLRAAKKCS